MHRKTPLAVAITLALVLGLCPATATADDGNANLTVGSTLPIQTSTKALRVYSQTKGKKTTNKNILAILKKYDADGYYIAKTTCTTPTSLSRYFHGAALYTDLKNFETTVHEQCHFYNRGSKALNTYRYYIGGKKGVKVPMTKVFKSKKTASSVPRQLRGSRWSDYVGVSKADEGMTSNKYGAYGLMDEFTAYCWGFTTYASMFKYAEKNYTTERVLTTYYNTSLPIAHAEFRYFIEHYLAYAKQHYPSVYKGIVNNKKFRKALKTVDSRFTSALSKYDSNFVDTVKLCIAEDGKFSKTVCSSIAEDDDWLGLCAEEYNRFADELGKSKYATITKKLGLKPVVKRSPKKLLAAKGINIDKYLDDDSDEED